MYMDIKEIIKSLNFWSDKIIKELKTKKVPKSSWNPELFKGLTGIYAFYEDNSLAYVGKTKSAHLRMHQHIKGKGLKGGKVSSSVSTKYNKIKGKNKIIHFSFVEVPLETYSSIEENIIKKIRNNNPKAWNMKGS